MKAIAITITIFIGLFLSFVLSTVSLQQLEKKGATTLFGLIAIVVIVHKFILWISKIMRKLAFAMQKDDFKKTKESWMKKIKSLS